MLAQHNPIIPIPNGSSALTQGKVVKAVAGEAVVTTAATEAVLGVVHEDCDADGTAAIIAAGSGAIVFVEAAASGIAIGDALVPAASGRAAKSAGTATHKPFAMALEASTAAGELIKAVLSTPAPPLA